MRTTTVDGVAQRGTPTRPTLTSDELYALKVGHPMTMSIASRIIDACQGPAGFERLYEAAHAIGISAHAVGGRDIWDAVNNTLQTAVETGRGIEFAETVLGLPRSAKKDDTAADKCGYVIARYLMGENQPFGFDDVDVKVNGNKVVARLRNYEDNLSAFNARHARTLVEVRAEAARAGYPQIAIGIEPIPAAAWP